MRHSSRQLTLKFMHTLEDLTIKKAIEMANNTANQLHTIITLGKTMVLP